MHNRNVVLGMTIVLLLSTAVSSVAQSITPEVVSSGGGDTTNANVGLSWTVGESVVETVSGSNGKITQGFHQSHYEIISIEDHLDLGYEINIFPNPSTDYIQITLKFNGKSQAPADTRFNILLTNNLGKQLLYKTIKNKLEFTLPMQEYAAGQYFLKITGAEGELYKSAQITKF